MADAFEKSLDEIIGEQEKPARRGGRGPRSRRESTGRGRIGGSSWRSDRARSRSRSGERRSGRGSYRDRDGDLFETKHQRLQRLIQGRYYIKITNLHYNITEDDLGDLLSTIGQLTFHYIEFDRSGRSTGTAYAQYRRLDDNQAAVDKFHGRRAAGQVIDVELIKPLRVRAVASERSERSGERRERRTEGSRRRRRADPEDLDKELDSYMNGGDDDAEEKKDGEEESKPRGGRGRRPKATTEDLDRELEQYMDQKPFPAV